MKVLHIIGADLSKKSIDLALHDSTAHLQIENSASGFKQLLLWLKQQKISTSQIMFVMEHTGLYSWWFEEFLYLHEIRFTKVSALAIKRSLGLVRGKTDKLDAVRIARYGFEKKDRLIVSIKTAESLKRLQMLHSTRESFVKDRASLICSLKEYQAVVNKTDIIIGTRLQLIKTYSQEIKKIEAEISKLIETHESIKQNFELLQTIKGVGRVVGIATIIKTKNFTAFADAKKFACYCGTAPFAHSSGTSIRKKTRISHLADKGMKTLLDQSAKSAIQHDKEIKEYYLRRIAIGKSKKSTINIVRNKIISRMFAVIKRQTPFVQDYLHVA